MTTQPIAVAAVLEYMALNQPGSTSQYSAGTVGSNIRSAAAGLEKATQRWFMDRPATTWTATSQGRAQVYIPGFRSFTSVSIATAPLVASANYWAVPDAQNSGIFVAIQFRPFTSQGPNRLPWNWFDTNADSPYDPRNYGGGQYQTSMPNDLVIVGNGGYADANLPEAFLEATKIWAAFKTMRPSSLLADVAITPQGGIVNYSQMPAEVANFIMEWKIGEQAVAA